MPVAEMVLDEKERELLCDLLYELNRHLDETCLPRLSQNPVRESLTKKLLTLCTLSRAVESLEDEP